MLEREEKVRREVVKAKDEELRKLVIATRKDAETAVRAEMEGRYKENSTADKARKIAEDGASQAMQVALVRVQKEQKDAIKSAVDAVRHELTAKHAIEIAALKVDEEKRIERAREEATKHAAHPHVRALAAEVEKRETLEAELAAVKAAASDASAARQAEAKARQEVVEANDSRAFMESYVTQQVTLGQC